MTPHSRFWRRTVILAALAFPLSLVSFGFGQPGTFRPPIGPRAGTGIAGGGGAGIPGGGGAMPRVPGIERYEFTCSKCGKVVTTGISQLSAEHIANCPHCGTRFGNTMAGDSASRMDDLRDRTRGVGGGRGGLATPGAGEHVPGLTNPPRNAPAPPIGGNPAIPGPADSGFGFSTSNSPVSGPPTTSARSRGSLIVLIIFVVGGLLLLLALAGIGLIIWMVRTAPSMSGGERVVKRRRPASTRYDPI